MAKELMEIGGFITSGAEIVNHDASLSGNGTVDSPLGLNETVLWEGTYSESLTQLICSESIANFEKIEVWWIQQNLRPIVNTYQTQNLGQIFVIHGKCENGAAVMFIAGWDKGSDNKTFTKNFCKYSPTDNWGTFVAVNELVPVKIVGINRKAQ